MLKTPERGLGEMAKEAALEGIRTAMTTMSGIKAMKYRIVTDHDGIFIVELQVTKVLSFGRERSEWKPVLYSNSLKKLKISSRLVIILCGVNARKTIRSCWAGIM